jgi:tyrosine-protein kinase
MDLRTYLRAIRKGWWIVLLLLVLGGAAGYVVSKRSSRIYAGHITFYVATPSLAGTTALGADQFAQDRANSYAELLSSERLAIMIVHATGVNMSPGELSGKITGSAALNTVLVKATVKDASRPRLRVVTVGVATEFPKMVDQLDNSGSAKPKIRLSVVSGPTIGSTPVSPRTKLNVALGLAVGLLLGLLLAALRETFQLSIRTAEALRQLSDAPVIGTIPLDAAAKNAPIVVGDAAYSRRAEAFRQLRTNLQFFDVTDPVKVLAVTSSVAGEGKSTVASNLALVFAETGLSVLLVDADLRRSKLADYLGIERLVGLTDVLAGQVDIDDALQPWGSNGLVLLPNGSVPPNPSALLGSARMHDLIGELRRRFEIIVVDTPPVLPITDAAVVAAYADGVVMVFRYGKTRRAHLATSLRQLRAVNARVLGFVFNMKPLPRRHSSEYGVSDRSSDQRAGQSIRYRPSASEHRPVSDAERPTEVMSSQPTLRVRRE